MKSCLVIPLFTLFHVLAYGQSFQSFFDAWINDPKLQNGIIGIQILELESNEILFDRNSEILLEPASNMKMVSSFAVMDELGPDFTYSTRLIYTGAIIDNVLHGDLVLIGSGDPTFCSKYFPELTLDMVADQVVQSLQKNNITSIKGAVIVDASVWDKYTIPETWSWNDIGNYYGAGAYGFNVSDNLYKIELNRSTTLGANCTVGMISPMIDGLTHFSQVVTAEQGSGDQAYIFGSPYQYQRYITGTIPVGTTPFEIKGSMPDPALFMAQFLESSLQENGISTQNPAWSNFDKITYSNATELHQWSSPSMAKIMDIGNAESVNLILEAGANTLWQGKSNDLDSWMKSYLVKKGLECSPCRFDDASGLSTSNSLHAQFLISFFKMADASELRDWFRSSLAVAGERGTMKYMFKNSPAKGRIQAKSGLVQDHRNYTGFVQTRQEKELLFSVMAYHPGISARNMTRKLEALMEAMYQYY